MPIPASLELIDAIAKGDPAQIAHLLGLGADPDATGPQGFPVWVHAISCDPKIFHLLVPRSDLPKASANGTTALMSAASDGNVSLLQSNLPA